MGARPYGYVDYAVLTLDVADGQWSSALTHSSDHGGAFTLVSVPPGLFVSHDSVIKMYAESEDPVVASDVDYLSSVYGFSTFDNSSDVLEIPAVALASVAASPSGLTVSLAECPWLVAHHSVLVHPDWVREASTGTTVLGICFGVDLDAAGVEGFFAELDEGRAVIGEAPTLWSP